MSDISREELMHMLQKDFSEKVADEILDMIDRLGRTETDTEKIEEDVTQYILHCIQKDVNATLKKLNGMIQVPQFKPGPTSKPKRKR